MIVSVVTIVGLCIAVLVVITIIYTGRKFYRRRGYIEFDRRDVAENNNVHVKVSCAESAEAL